MLKGVGGGQGVKREDRGVRYREGGGKGVGWGWGGGWGRFGSSADSVAVHRLLLMFTLVSKLFLFQENVCWGRFL